MTKKGTDLFFPHLSRCLFSGEHPDLFPDFYQYIPAQPLLRQVRKPDQNHRHQNTRIHPGEDHSISAAKL